MVHGANSVTLSEETESNRENKPAPKVTKAHIYSTQTQEMACLQVLHLLDGAVLAGDQLRSAIVVGL